MIRTIPSESFLLQPHSINDLALSKMRQDGDPAAAIAIWKQFLMLHPNDPAAWGNLGASYLEAGEHTSAAEALRHAIKLAPELLPLRSALILVMQYGDGFSQQELDAETADFADLARGLVVPETAWDNDRDPHRRLRIGYVTSDLRQNHAVSRFMAPILRYHTAGVEVFIYHTGQPDQTTFAMIGGGEGWWSDAEGRTDSELADEIRADGIDILVDLNMHTQGGRPLLFARDPAPVTVNYLGTPGWGGLTDYFFTDAAITPEENPRAIHLGSYWGYESPAYGPVDASPATDNGFVTFGSLAQFQKVTDSCLSAWARIMAAVPDSRLLLHCPPGPSRDRVRRYLPAERVDFESWMGFADYLETYGRIDIVLDTFPFCGGTTTCDALWMGLPVVTLAGERPASRSGLSLLAAYGADHLAASNADLYVATARMFARELPSRELNRQWMRRSPLMNMAGHVADLERAYRMMWWRYCGGVA